VYARHGHEPKGCKTPAGEPKTMIASIPKWIITTGRRQGRSRERLSEGQVPLQNLHFHHRGQARAHQQPALQANLRADGQKSHGRPGSRVSGHNTTKPVGSRNTVNAAVAYRMQVRGVSTDAEALCRESSCPCPGETCLTCGSSEQRLQQ